MHLEFESYSRWVRWGAHSLSPPFITCIILLCLLSSSSTVVTATRSQWQATPFRLRWRKSVISASSESCLFLRRNKKEQAVPSVRVWQAETTGEMSDALALQVSLRSLKLKFSTSHYVTKSKLQARLLCLKIYFVVSLIVKPWPHC